MTENQFQKLVEQQLLEQRRGVIVLAVLSQLDEPRYGYALIKLLAAAGIEIEQGTLYPLLRRLEAKGLLESDWQVEENRPRRYYVISDLGRKVYKALADAWMNTSKGLQELLR